jgi:hypothetical protein
MGRLQKLAAYLLILGFLYANIDGMLLSWHIRFTPTAWNRGYLSNFFYMYGVFLEVHRTNREYVAFGSTARLGEIPRAPTSGMMDLNLRQYYPQSHGESNQRLSFAGYLNRPSCCNVEYDKLAFYIKRLHNIDKPQQQVQGVYIYVLYWPASSQGYYARVDEAEVEFLGWN